jgi:molybdopterin-containing oxidoreductase family iron-sulfur binding subunit
MKPNPQRTAPVGAQPDAPQRPSIDLAAIGAKLAGAHGPAYWRSVEELAGTTEFQQMQHREFPAGASEWEDTVSRRNFLKMAGASLALAGLPACTKQPTREIYPYVNQPAELVVGEPLYYATSMLLGGYATGALVKSREGHPIKVEGSPEHPACLGGSSVWLQASILDLYDPDRSKAAARDGEVSTRDSFAADLHQLMTEQRAVQGSGLRFLTETITSPTLATQLEEVRRRFPKSKWYQYDPVARDNVREGARLAFSEFAEAHYQFDAAEVILSLESDFLQTHPERLRYARHFTDGRRVSAQQKQMNRLYVVESSPSMTGSMADHRLRLSSSKVEGLVRLLCNKLGLGVEETPDSSPHAAQPWFELLLNDLRNHRATSLILAGEYQPPIVHALAHVLNEHLANTGKTVFYTAPVEARPQNQMESLRQLANELRSGTVEALVILGGNPAYTAPADLQFGELLLKVKRSIHLGIDLDETAARCSWHLPAKHYLESWGDARSFDGTISLLQPLIAPMYDGISPYELLGMFIQEQPFLSDYEIVRNFWRSQDQWPDFELGWREALHNGFISNTAIQRKQLRVQGIDKVLSSAGSSATANANAATGLTVRSDDLEICFRPDPNVWDGRFANNGWLQECPKPLSKLTWGNAALISPALGQQHGLTSGDVVELEVSGRRLQAPVWLMPGQADQTITLHLGHGRERVGRIGTGVGFNAYLLRTADSPWTAKGVLTKTPHHYQLVSTQTHHGLDSPERQVLRNCTWTEFQADSQVVKESVESPRRDETLYDTKEYPYNGYKWGMSIDLTTCIGCNACLVACEAENNIPFVGKDQVRRHREMFWIRIDTYYRGSLEDPRFTHMPVPCMHCEHAPCELVCPVEATVHDQEGLNLQVYNRCVGTRFCSNNCPYKVRRFNFFQYAQYHQPSYEPMYNPEVTVRWRGVMEKCTYCIQRISAARINAEKQNRRIREVELKTACQQACPATAIIFGDLNDANSQVAQLKKSPLDYAMLGQLNTRPRTTYLAKVENPNSQAEISDGISRK